MRGLAGSLARLGRKEPDAEERGESSSADGAQTDFDAGEQSREPHQLGNVDEMAGSNPADHRRTPGGKETWHPATLTHAVAQSQGARGDGNRRSLRSFHCRADAGRNQ